MVGELNERITLQTNWSDPLYPMSAHAHFNLAMIKAFDCCFTNYMQVVHFLAALRHFAETSVMKGLLTTADLWKSSMESFVKQNVNLSDMTGVPCDSNANASFWEGGQHVFEYVAQASRLQPAQYFS